MIRYRQETSLLLMCTHPDKGQQDHEGRFCLLWLVLSKSPQCLQEKDNGKRQSVLTGPALLDLA